MTSLEAVGSVWQLVGALYVCQEGLLAEAKLHLGAEEAGVVEVGDDSLYGQSVSHLDHGAALLRLEELDPDDVAVEAEQVEDATRVHLVRVEAVHHAHGALEVMQPTVGK